jgi:hypothetical protein
MNNNVEASSFIGPPRRAVYRISNWAPVIAVDPAPHAATALRAQTLEKDRVYPPPHPGQRMSDRLVLGRVAKAPSQAGHSYAISPGRSCKGAIVTTSLMAHSQRGQATLLGLKTSDTGPLT